MWVWMMMLMMTLLRIILDVPILFMIIQKLGRIKTISEENGTLIKWYLFYDQKKIYLKEKEEYTQQCYLSIF